VQQAVMYADYTGVKQSFNIDDVNGLQSIYGAIPANSHGNSSLSTATNITGQINASGQVAVSGLAITGSSDQDFFEVTVPASTTGSMTVSIQATGLSSLAPRVTIYNGNRTAIAQTSNANLYGSTATYTLTNVSPGQVYYIRATAANTGAGCAGAYGLLVNFGSQRQPTIAPPYTTVATAQGASSTGNAGAETTGAGSGG